MSGEYQLTQSWVYQKGSVGPYQRSTPGPLSIDVAGSNGVNDFTVLSVTPTAINLGTISGALGWAWFRNADATNSINLYTGNGGTIFCKLLPGESASFRFGSGVTAPYAAAVAGTPTMEYLVLPP